MQRNKSSFFLKKILFVVLGIYSCFFFLVEEVFAATRINQQEPIQLLQGIANNMIAGLKLHQATLRTKPKIVYDLAYRYVVPYADLSEMSKRVLPPDIWKKASTSERLAFQKQFTLLLIRTYASALTSYKDQLIQFYPIRGGIQGQNTVVVNSQITSSSAQPLNVSYRLVHTDNVWRLYDMSVEGVSMLGSFRSQFADILSRGTMQQLIAELSRHNRVG